MSNFQLKDFFERARISGNSYNRLMVQNDVEAGEIRNKIKVRNSFTASFVSMEACRQTTRNFLAAFKSENRNLGNLADSLLIDQNGEHKTLTTAVVRQLEKFSKLNEMQKKCINALFGQKPAILSKPGVMSTPPLNRALTKLSELLADSSTPGETTLFKKAAEILNNPEWNPQQAAKRLTLLLSLIDTNVAPFSAEPFSIPNEAINPDSALFKNAGKFMSLSEDRTNYVVNPNSKWGTIPSLKGCFSGAELLGFLAKVDAGEINGGEPIGNKTLAVFSNIVNEAKSQGVNFNIASSRPLLNSLVTIADALYEAEGVKNIKESPLYDMAMEILKEAPSADDAAQRLALTLKFVDPQNPKIFEIPVDKSGIKLRQVYTPDFGNESNHLCQVGKLALFMLFEHTSEFMKLSSDQSTYEFDADTTWQGIPNLDNEEDKIFNNLPELLKDIEKEQPDERLNILAEHLNEAGGKQACKMFFELPTIKKTMEEIKNADPEAHDSLKEEFETTIIDKALMNSTFLPTKTQQMRFSKALYNAFIAVALQKTFLSYSTLIVLPGGDKKPTPGVTSKTGREAFFTEIPRTHPKLFKEGLSFKDLGVSGKFIKGAVYFNSETRYGYCEKLGSSKEDNETNLKRTECPLAALISESFRNHIRAVKAPQIFTIGNQRFVPAEKIKNGQSVANGAQKDFNDYLVKMRTAMVELARSEECKKLELASKKDPNVKLTTIQRQNIQKDQAMADKIANIALNLMTNIIGAPNSMYTDLVGAEFPDFKFEKCEPEEDGVARLKMFSRADVTHAHFSQSYVINKDGDIKLESMEITLLTPEEEQKKINQLNGNKLQEVQA